MNLLVALFGATFSKISEAADLRYNLERARIILSFEQAMSDSERTSEVNKYWILTHGQPYLVVEEKDDSIYANDDCRAAVLSAIEFVKALPPAPARPVSPKRP